MKWTPLLAITLSACAPDAAFHCDSSEQCRTSGTIGTCETTGFCSFPDATCESGARYTGEGAGDLSGACVEGHSNGTDSDADGVVDAKDNCPHNYNPDQGNEDGDGYGDVCDPCPFVADSLVTDTDGDGLDDRCDPHLGKADHIVLFEGFHHGLPAGWTTSGNLDAAGDALVGTGDGSGSGSGTDYTMARAIVPYEVTASSGITIYAGITPTNILYGSSNAVHVEGLVAAFAGSDYLMCALHQQAMTQLFGVYNTGSNTSNTQPWAVAPGNTYTVRMDFDGSRTYTCAVSRDAANIDATLSSPIPLPDTAYRTGLYVQNAGARLEWIMIVSE